jgi:hypothetical protein
MHWELHVTGILPNRGRKLMVFGRQLGAALFATSIALCSAQTAIAGESGSFSAVMGFNVDYTKIEFAGGNVTGGALRGPSTITKSSGGPFVEGESGTRVCVVFAKETSAGVQLEAPCVLTDKSGDKLYMLAIRGVGDVSAGGGGAGTQQIMGGTGKYAGMSGSCNHGRVSAGGYRCHANELRVAEALNSMAFARAMPWWSDPASPDAASAKQVARTGEPG